MEVRPFTIHVSDDVLEDLRRRLGHTRFPDEMPGSGWDYGASGVPQSLGPLLAHGLRLASQEEKSIACTLKTLGDGLNIIHPRTGHRTQPMPLVMTHAGPVLFSR